MLHSVLFYLLLSFENANCRIHNDSGSDLEGLSEQNGLVNISDEQVEIISDNVRMQTLSDFFQILKKYLIIYEKELGNKQSEFLSEIQSLISIFINNENPEYIANLCLKRIENIVGFSILVYRAQILNDICNLYSYDSLDEFMHLYNEINQKFKEITTLTQYNEDLTNQTKDKIKLFCKFTKNRCTRLLHFISEIKGLDLQLTQQNPNGNNFLFGGKLIQNENFLLPVIINSEEKIKILLKEIREIELYILCFDFGHYLVISDLMARLIKVFDGFNSFKPSEAKPEGFDTKLLNFMQFECASLTLDIDMSIITEYMCFSTQNTEDFQKLSEILFDFLNSFCDIQTCLKHYKVIYNSKPKTAKEREIGELELKYTHESLSESVSLFKIRIEEYSSYQFGNPLLQDFAQKIVVSIKKDLDNFVSL